MAKKVSLGVVGMGIGKPNARAIARHARGEVVALCDLDEERMAEFAKELLGENRMVLLEITADRVMSWKDDN